MSGAEKYIDDDEMPMDVMCDDLFDHIDDLLDFPNYDAVAADYMAMEAGLSKDQDITHYTHNQQQGAPFSPPPLPLPAPPRVDGLLGSDNRCAMPIAGTDSNTNDKLLDELDIADLEWVSNFMDDSSDSYSLDFSNTAHMIHVETTTTQHETMFRTTSPVSVLQSNSLTSSHGGSVSSSSSSSSFSYSSNAGNVFDNRRPKIRFTNSPKPSMPLAIPARARSKRPRPATFSIRPHVTIPILPPSSSLPPPPLDIDNFGESRTPPAIDYKNTKKYKKNLSVATPLWTGSDDTTPAPPGIRKCMHCEIQKTPQWRAGPMGPKTLCNACGVRYKSGRLFPEYRPAASPTFVPSIHSNSHKKVVEMRINCTPKTRLESCDLLDYIRRS